MSGIAIDLPTIPGIVATFATCSSAKSFRTCSIIVVSAKIRPSVRIAGLYDWGIRNLNSSSCWVGPFHSSAIRDRGSMRAVHISVFCPDGSILAEGARRTRLALDPSVHDVPDDRRDDFERGEVGRAE